MKVIHLDKKSREGDNTLEKIKELEEAIKKNPSKESGYTKLMSLYRQQKEYKKELKLINTAIKTFEEIFKKRQPVYDRKVKSLSTALSKAMGLVDKKGNSLYEMGELAKWRRRKVVVEKKASSPLPPLPRKGKGEFNQSIIQ